MSFFSRIRQTSALLSCLICLSATAATPVKPAATDSVPTAKIEVDEHNQILVPVTINGSGPYTFMLDTGAEESLMEQKLADELALPVVRKVNVLGVLNTSIMSVVHANSVSVAGAAVNDLELAGSDRRLSINSKVRGILGEDFLKHFEVLIDYRHQALQLGAESFAERAVGERLSLQSTQGQRSDGQRTSDRLIVSGRIPDLGKQPMSLLVDSGATYLTLFKDGGPDLTATPNVRIKAGVMDSWKQPDARTRTVRALYVGKNSASEVTLVEISNVKNADTDGLMPTVLFHSVLISHRGGYVILNPSFPKTPVANRPELLAALAAGN